MKRNDSARIEMSRALNDLHHSFRPLAFELLARCVEKRIYVVIVDTLRTQIEHEINLAKGVSWIQHSKHLDGLAIDICLVDEYKLHGPNKLDWSASNPAWQELGNIGESIGLRWGGRWKKRDMGHFELVRDEKGMRA
jgi:peptidoglycan L-alanyl-D-glutamate endopeptidase CwlK